MCHLPQKCRYSQYFGLACQVRKLYQETYKKQYTECNGPLPYGNARRAVSTNTKFFLFFRQERFCGYRLISVTSIVHCPLLKVALPRCDKISGNWEAEAGKDECGPFSLFCWQHFSGDSCGGIDLRFMQIRLECFGENILARLRLPAGSAVKVPRAG